MLSHLFDADSAHTPEGAEARATTTVVGLLAHSISDVFASYAEARSRGDQDRMEQISSAVGPQMAAELDGFNYLAAA